METVKLSDWLADHLVGKGIRQVFMITGGGAMHLNQSLGSHRDLKCVFNHHEQACSMAAEAYGRLTNQIAVVNVTSGPGGTNAITGVYGAFTDSIAMLVISGQVKYETTVRSTGLPLRQYGDQELDIQQLIAPITKYSVMVTDPESIRYHVDKALYLARSGRPGPCWIDIPLDVQSARIDPSSLQLFDPSELEEPWKKCDLVGSAKIIMDALQESKRPVIMAGGGVRNSGAHKEFIEFIEKSGVPVVTGWNAHDALWSDHPQNCGKPGTVGDRGGNFTVQSSDLLIVFGSRLNIRQVSYNWRSFAKKAKKIWIDIDHIELSRPNVRPDIPIVADLTELLPVLAAYRYSGPSDIHRHWLRWCRERNNKYPVVAPSYATSPQVNPYFFAKLLFEQLPKNQIVVTANGSACVIGFQAAVLKQGQRLWTNSGCASMGYELPAAIGASLGSESGSVVCLAGDGSIMMNLQELQTIVGMKLPIKIFLLNNSGYVSIFQTHRNFFNGREIGAGPSSGVSFPEFERLAAGFGIRYERIANHREMRNDIARTLAFDGPVLCEVMVDPDQPFAPKLASRQLADGRMESPELEDMAPFLSREELASNVIEEEKN
jgi:acetolactate synthase-1/2/3 large subunit